MRYSKPNLPLTTILVASITPALAVLLIVIVVVVLCVQRRRYTNRMKPHATETPEPEGGMIVLPDVQPERLSVARMDKHNSLS